MRRLFDGSLVKERPGQAATFVDNHDSQPLQMLESAVEPWFVPLAYASTLLRRDGTPCLFHPDYYGAEYEDAGRRVTLPSHRFLIDVFLKARRDHGHGDQVDTFDHWDRVGWVRPGDGPAGTKWMPTHRPPGTRFHDITGHVPDPVVVPDGDGRAEFRCRERSVSVWVEA